MSRRVLVLSGGGCKGYIQATALMRHEKLVGSLTQYYDLIIGTSVGAINGGILSLDVITAQELFLIYPQMMQNVFKNRLFPLTPKYDRNNFISVFLKRFGKPRMKECLTRFVCTAINRVDDLTHYFKSWETKDGEEYVCDCLCRSFAAPFYFGQINDEHTKSIWIDGGCATENVPLNEAFIETVIQGWFGTGDIYFDIFGTGFVEDQDTYEDLSKDRWLKQALAFMKPCDGGLARAMSRQEQINGLVKICKSNSSLHMKYFDVMIKKEHDKMDGVDLIGEYREYGNAVKPIISM